MARLVSIIVPVLNEVENLGDLAQKAQGDRSEIEYIVVDGGSDDGSLDAARPWADKVVSCQRGRALQMNAGAGLASGEFLLFLHADTRLPDDLQPFLSALASAQPDWGFFRVQLRPANCLLRLVATLMNWRSRATSVATGDQAIFVRRELFERTGGFDAIPLMEDVAFSKKLRRCGAPLQWHQKVTVSSRRWRNHGVARTIFLMWLLRLQYVLGVSPSVLHKRYYGRSLDHDR